MIWGKWKGDCTPTTRRPDTGNKEEALNPSNEKHAYEKNTALNWILSKMFI